MAKLTKLQPVLVERTCEYCGDGLLRLKEQCDDGIHLFRETKYWYEYECKKNDFFYIITFVFNKYFLSSC